MPSSIAFLRSSRHSLNAASALRSCPLLWRMLAWLKSVVASRAVSPSVSTGEVVFSLVAFFLLYAALAVVAVKLMMKYARREIAPAPSGEADEPVVVPAMTY